MVQAEGSIMSRTALPILARIAKEAGDKVLAMQADVIANQRWETKGDDTPVTIADKEANRIVCGRLAEYCPTIPVVSEENSPESNQAALQADERFDTDPLDNTSGYIKGLDGFSVNIGRIKNGVPIAGAIYFPARQELYFTGDDGKAYLQKGDAAPKRIQASRLPLPTPLRAAVGFNEENVPHLQTIDHIIEKHPGQMRTCMVAQGKCEVTGVNQGYGGGFESWDTAGPHAVLLAAGGDIVTTEGKSMRYGKESTKLPDHIAGAKDALIALNLASAENLAAGRKR